MHNRTLTHTGSGGQQLLDLCCTEDSKPHRARVATAHEAVMLQTIRASRIAAASSAEAAPIAKGVALRAKIKAIASQLPATYADWGPVKSKAWISLAQVSSRVAEAEAACIVDLEGMLALLLSFPSWSKDECRNYLARC